MLPATPAQVIKRVICRVSGRLRAMYALWSTPFDCASFQAWESRAVPIAVSIALPMLSRAARVLGLNCLRRCELAVLGCAGNWAVSLNDLPTFAGCRGLARTCQASAFISVRARFRSVVRASWETPAAVAFESSSDLPSGWAPTSGNSHGRGRESERGRERSRAWRRGASRGSRSNTPRHVGSRTERQSDLSRTPAGFRAVREKTETRPSTRTPREWRTGPGFCWSSAPCLLSSARYAAKPQACGSWHHAVNALASFYPYNVVSSLPAAHSRASVCVPSPLDPRAA